MLNFMMNENYCKKVLNRNAKCVILRDKVPCFIW